MSVSVIQSKHPCPICGDETHGHAVHDPSRTLCRDCFHAWIVAPAKDGSIESALEAMDLGIEGEGLRACAERIRARHHQISVEVLGSLRRAHGDEWIRDTMALCFSPLARDPDSTLKATRIPRLRWVATDGGELFASAEFGPWRLRVTEEPPDGLFYRWHVECQLAGAADYESAFRATGTVEMDVEDGPNFTAWIAQCQAEQILRSLGVVFDSERVDARGEAIGRLHRHALVTSALPFFQWADLEASWPELRRALIDVLGTFALTEMGHLARKGVALAEMPNELRKAREIAFRSARGYSECDRDERALEEFERARLLLCAAQGIEKILAFQKENP